MLSERLGFRMSDEDAAALADAISGAFTAHPPEMIAGALDAVRAAAALVPVGLISDTGMTPGTEIRALLDRAGFGEHIRAFSFSDEVGVAKPQSAIFRHAASELGVDPDALLHLGDLEPTDIVGALNVGAQAGLFAGDNRKYVDGTRAAYVFPTWSTFSERLPRLID